jgi:hypothetical protein
MNKIKVVVCHSPRGYRPTNIYFFNPQLADSYINSQNNEFFKEKEVKLKKQFNSKRKWKETVFSKPKKYLLTMIGNRFRLWEEMK